MTTQRILISCFARAVSALLSGHVPKDKWGRLCCRLSSKRHLVLRCEVAASKTVFESNRTRENTIMGILTLKTAVPQNATSYFRVPSFYTFHTLLSPPVPALLHKVRSNENDCYTPEHVPQNVHHS